MRLISTHQWRGTHCWSSEDSNVRKNVQRSLATDLQSLSMELRKKQSTYLKRLQQQKEEVYKNRLLERNPDAPPEKQYDDPNFEIWKDIVSVKKNRLLGFGERTKFQTTFERDEALASTTEIQQLREQ